MKNEKKIQSFPKIAWIALVLITGASTFILIIPYAWEPAGPAIKIISLASWFVVVLSALALFFNAKKTPSAVPVELKKNEDEETGEARSFPGEKKNEFDIHALAKKISRRINNSSAEKEFTGEFLSILSDEIEIMAGVFYLKNRKGEFKTQTSFAMPKENLPESFREGEGLHGQAALEKQVKIYRADPENSKNVFSGLGIGKPAYLAFVPIVSENKTIGLFEVAGFRHSNENLSRLFSLLAKEIALKLDQDRNHKRDN